MRTLYLATLLLVAGGASAATMGSAAAGGFVKGVTTVAQAEQNLGAPADTTMNPDGALTLIYPSARFAERMPAALPGVSSPKVRTVALQFSTDFTYQHASLKTAKTADTGLAER